MPDIQQVEAGTPLTEEDKQKARKVVAGMAIDAAEAAELLNMLGLHGPEFRDCPGRATWYRKGICRCRACTRKWAKAKAERVRKARQKAQEGVPA